MQPAPRRYTPGLIAFDAACALLLVLAGGIFVYHFKSRPIETASAPVVRCYQVQILAEEAWSDSALHSLIEHRTYSTGKTTSARVTGWSGRRLDAVVSSDAMDHYGQSPDPGAPVVIRTDSFVLRGHIVAARETSREELF